MLRVAFGAILVVICVAHPGFRDLIPNGNNVPNPCINVPFLWNAVGHNTSLGGGAPNVFGAAFGDANATWTAALCQADSDGDGKSNGVELGDPDCTWKPGNKPSGDATGHPGVCEPMSKEKCMKVNKNILCICETFPKIILP